MTDSEIKAAIVERQSQAFVKIRRYYRTLPDDVKIRDNMVQKEFAIVEKYLQSLEKQND